MSDPVSFGFNDETIEASAGMSVAAALTQSGIRALRETDSGKARGMFCGMGVCQDCLVEIDGQPNQRACMTPIADGMRVRTQAPRPSLDAPLPPKLTSQKLSPEVLVIGGGPGGLNAALAAAESGAKVLLLDERKTLGGQFFKQPATDALPLLDPQQDDGAKLIARCRSAGVEFLLGAEIWGAFEGPVIYANTFDKSLVISPDKLILSTGAYERPLMIPGWTLPGVMTAGAAQTLWRSYRVPAGKRVAVFGNGPLNQQIALELAAAGAKIVTLGEAAGSPMRRIWSGLEMLRRDPMLTFKGAAMLAKLWRKGVRLTHATLPERIDADDGGSLDVTYRQRGQLKQCKVDAVLLNFGFQPQNEILRLLGAEMIYDAGFDQLRPTRNEIMKTSVDRVFAVGDCCGLGGAPAAEVEGLIAGRAAAGDPEPTPSETRSLRNHRAFQSALWRLYAAELPDLDTADETTTVCRCEEISKQSLDTALAENPTDIGAVKRATRIGMGRCQGRYCGPAAVRYLAKKTGEPIKDHAFFAPRVPIKPVALSVVADALSPLDDDEH